MRFILFIFLFFVLSSFYDSDESIRKNFHDSMFSEQKLEHFFQSKHNGSTVSMAYKGISETMLAKFAFLPTTKLKLFNNGRQKVDQAVKTQKENAEIRYIRLLIQLNAPSMLGYDSNVNEDLQKFTKNCCDQIKDKFWLKKFITNLQSAEKISDTQKNILNQLLKKL